MNYRIAFGILAIVMTILGVLATPGNANAASSRHRLPATHCHAKGAPNAYYSPRPCKHRPHMSHGFLVLS